jgi:Protein of unknown function (DUF732)
MGRHGGHQKPSPPADVNNPPGQYPPQGSYVPQGQDAPPYSGYQQAPGQPLYRPPPQGLEGPQYQQGPGQPLYGPPPQRRTRHRVRRVLIISGAVTVAFILLVVVTSGKGKPPTTPKASSTTSATPAPTSSLTAAQQQFVNAMSTKYGLGTGTSASDSSVLGVGNSVCGLLKDGGSESTIADVIQQSRSSLSASDAAGIVSLAGQNLCPQDVPAPFVAQTLLTDSGSGDDTTAQFTVGGTGDYKVYWTYNEGSFGQSVNFQLWADGGSDSAFTDPNQLANGGSGVVNVYNDAGNHTITVNSEGNWTLKVVTAP